jgi:cholesterol oxidase
MKTLDKTFDFVIIGSGFGGSVSAMRLTEKGYSVLVLERGLRFEDSDYARRNWNIWKYLWMPGLRCFGILQLILFKGLFVFGGSGVGGGSLVYAAVLMEPEDAFFNAPTWSHLGDWKERLRLHYATARRMLGVAANPRLTPADHALSRIAGGKTEAGEFRPTDVGIFFGEPDQIVPDPYFNGSGSDRSGCNFCGGCMVGCRYNAKNTLPKNYLYFAEAQGAEVFPACKVTNIKPLPDRQSDGARYEVQYTSSNAWLYKPIRAVRARNVLVAAGVLGTMNLLLNCRDVHRSLPELSSQLGKFVRTNSEAFVGAFKPGKGPDHSKGISISSIFRADEDTQIEPLRFSEGSSFIFWILSIPMIQAGGSFLNRLWKIIIAILRRPGEYINMKLAPGLSQRGVALMIMQTKDNLMNLKLGRNFHTGYQRGLVSQHDVGKRIPVDIELGHQVARTFAREIDGYPVGSVPEGILNVPTTAHMLGGCLIGRDSTEGVINEDFQVHHYPGLYIVDGSVVPANPGVNPSLTITALAEYAMSRIPQKDHSEINPGSRVRVQTADHHQDA